MNSLNDTVVSPQMMKELKDAGLDGGYRPIPNNLLTKAKTLLNGGHLATMDADMKRKLRNIKKAKRRTGVRGY